MSANDSERDRVTTMILRMSIEQRLALVIRLRDYYHGAGAVPTEPSYATRGESSLSVAEGRS